MKMRVSFATWAPVDDPGKLRRRMSLLSQRIEGWGNAKATMVVGDPLEGVMSTVPGLGACLDREPIPGPAGRRPDHASLEPHCLALGERQRAVPAT